MCVPASLQSTCKRPRALRDMELQPGLPPVQQVPLRVEVRVRPRVVHGLRAELAVPRVRCGPGKARRAGKTLQNVYHFLILCLRHFLSRYIAGEGEGNS